MIWSVQKRGSAFKKGAGAALDKCICLRGPLYLSRMDTVGVLHTQIQNKHDTFLTGTELWAPGVRTDIALGKEKTALASTREKWLSGQRNRRK